MDMYAASFCAVKVLVLRKQSALRLSPQRW